MCTFCPSGKIRHGEREKARPWMAVPQKDAQDRRNKTTGKGVRKGVKGKGQNEVR